MGEERVVDAGLMEMSLVLVLEGGLTGEKEDVWM